MIKLIEKVVNEGRTVAREFSFSYGLLFVGVDIKFLSCSDIVSIVFFSSGLPLVDTITVITHTTPMRRTPVSL